MTKCQQFSRHRKPPSENGGLKRKIRSSQSGKVAPDTLMRWHRRQTMLSSPSPPSDRAGRKPATGCQALFLPSRGTHFRKRSRLSGRGASLVTACAVPNGLRSYRPIGQTLVNESPSLSLMPHGATRHGRERGSPFRVQLLRSVAPLSPHSPSLPAFLGFPPPDVP